MMVAAVSAIACVDEAAGPDPGIAVADFYVAIEGQTLEVDAVIGVLVNDGAGASAIEASGLITRELGVAVVAGDGAFTYTPALGAWGVDEFTYEVEAAGLPPSRATVRIMVVPVTLALGELLGSGRGFVVDGPSGDRLGAGAVGVADVSGDGVAELVIAAPDADTIAVDAGRAYLLRGGEALGDAQEIVAAAELWASGARGLVIDGEAAGDRLASALTSGDLDGDGLDRKSVV